ncbi:MAG: TonB family protein [Acidobacteriota bacterium]
MKVIRCIGIVLVAAGTAFGAQDPLSAAKDLYASAAYEDALSALSRLDAESSTPQIARQADEYRAFSLYALGRTQEAESIAEAMIRKDPLAPLNAADASPRIEAMFVEVRKRLLPSLIRERFRSARSAVDQKSFKIAEAPLNQARLMIVEAEKLGVQDDGLSDLNVLVDGFLQLVRSTLEQQASPARPAGAPPVSEAASRSSASPAGAAGASRSNPPAAGASRAVSPTGATSSSTGRVYSIDDQDVSPPAVIDQRITGLPAEVTQMIKATRATGLVEVIIDETGSVVDATIRQSVNIGFDGAILRAARRWKYRPAMKDGVPVRYVKILALVP